MSPEPFNVTFAAPEVAALRARLATTRWPDLFDPDEWELGSGLSYVQGLCGHWGRHFDFDERAAALNELPQFTTLVDGYRVHFVHAAGHGAAPLPLIFTHGWPGSFFEVHKLVDMLTNPGAHGAAETDAFTVVAPSLPGYGYSEVPREVGWGPARTAGTWNKLMLQLGYNRYGAQGGDWGAFVSAHLGHSYGEHVVGAHINLPVIGPISDRTPHNQDEIEYLRRAQTWQRAHGGYAAIQSTKPATLAYGLADSPAGLAAWIVEKFRAWSDCNGDVETRFSKDELLTNISIYWFTNTIASSVRFYHEMHTDPANRLTHRIPVPVGVSVFPREVSAASAPQSWVERGCEQLTQWSTHSRGGHFPAMEEPELLAADIREFFRPFR